jgi:hypothetical protein
MPVPIQIPTGIDPSTGLEAYALPFLYASGAMTAIATWLTVGRLRLSADLITPAGAAMVSAAILFAGTTMTLVGLLGATIMDPRTNHFWVSLLLWSVNTLAPTLFCAKPTTTKKT